MLTEVIVAAPPVIETRDYAIKVDGKAAGESHLTITEDNGTTAVTGHVDVRVRFLGGLYSYVYKYQGTEVWKDSRLQRLDSTTTDDKKHFTISASIDGVVMRITTNGQTRSGRADAWTTSYWKLPPEKYRNRAIVLLDVDSGREIVATLQYLGTETLDIGGRRQNCTHYRISGGVQVEAWYDAQERMVKQESIEDGHRTATELTRIGS